MFGAARINFIDTGKFTIMTSKILHDNVGK